MLRLFLLSIAIIVSASSQVEMSFDRAAGRWSLGNGVIEAGFRLTDAGYFQATSFSGPGGQWAAVEQLVSPIQLTANDRVYNARTPWRLVDQFHNVTTRGGTVQTIILRDHEETVQVTLEFTLYPRQPVLRQRVKLKNLSESAIHVTSADLMSWAFEDRRQRYKLLSVNQWNIIPAPLNFEVAERDVLRGEKAVVVQSGSRAPHCSWFAVADGNGRGLFAGWEFDGRAEARVQHIAERDALSLSVAIDDMHHPVSAGQEFALPAAFLGSFTGDWDEAGFRTQHYVESVLAKPPVDPELFPYVVWDSWGYDQNIDEQTLRRNAEAAARLGFELFIVDLGWARSIGDWRDDPAKFPSGLRRLSDYVHSLGMKFGLHFALAEAAPNSPVLRNNPDWTSSRSYSYFGASSLCFGHRPVREWIVAEAIRMIDEYNVDWILQDGENMVKFCGKHTHTHHPLDSNYSNSVEGLNAVVSAIQEARPNVQWENCADGGTMMTFQMVQNYVTSITNDASGVFDSRQAVWGATYPFPARYANRYMAETPSDTYTSRSFMFGGNWNWMNRLADLTPEQEQFAAREMQLFKAARGGIRQSKIFHIAAPARNTVDAIQSYHPESRRAVAVVTRDEGSASDYMLQLRGLDENTTYRITFANSDRIYQSTGLQLMRGGIPIYLPESRSAEIVFAAAVQ